MEKIELKVKTRQAVGKELNKLRQEGFVPAVLYGHNTKNQNIQVSARELAKIYSQAGESTLIDLTIDDKAPTKVLIQDTQRDPVKDSFVHVDFYQVNMTEKITTEIELNFIGESKAVKELGGVLVKNTNSIEVKCLPGDLVSKIDVDISVLETFDDAIHVKDLDVSDKIKVLTDIEEIVATVMPPRTAEELEKLDEKVEGEEVPEEADAEGEEKEGEEAAEGEEGEKKEGDDKAEGGKKAESSGSAAGSDEKKK